MSENILNTNQGSAFFVDLQKVIEDETKREKKVSDERKHIGGTALFIPLFNDSASSNQTSKTALGPTSDVGLSSTFTKEDFEKLKNENKINPNLDFVASSPRRPCSSGSRLSDLDSRSRTSSLSSQIENQPHEKIIRSLKKTKSSPNILLSPRLPQLEKSHQELKELITEYDKKEKEHLQLVWSSTYTRLPKLPKWLTDKQMSLDSQISPFASPDTSSEKQKQDASPKQHQVHIEELYCDSKPMQNDVSLPPIKPKTGCGNKTPKLKRSIPSACQNKNNKNKQDKQNSNKSPGKTKLSKQSTNKETKKTTKKKRGKRTTKFKTAQGESMSEVAARGDVAVEEILGTVDQILSKSESGSILAEENKPNFINPLPMLINTEKSVRNSQDISMEDSIEIFYDKVLKAEHVQDAGHNFSVIEKDLNMKLTKENMDLYNSFGKLIQSKNKDSLFNLNTIELASTLDKTLSLEENESHVGSTSGFEVPQLLQLRSDMLSKISEEKSCFTSVSSSNRHQFAPPDRSFSSSSMTSIQQNSDGSFQEITKLMFQPGIVSNNMSQGSIGNSSTISSPDVTLCSSNDRPYVRSALGRISARSLYTSSSEASNEDVRNTNILEWQKGKVIDRGAFGVVYQGLTNTGQMIAVKEVNIGHSKNATKVCILLCSN